MNSIYYNNINSGKIGDNIKDKVSYGLKAFWPEISGVTSIAAGAVAGLVILKKLPAKGIFVGKAVSESITKLSATSGINIVTKGSKVTALNIVKPLDKKLILNPKSLAIAGGIAIGVTAYYAIKKIGSAHLVNSGSSNYLGQKRIQGILYKSATD